MAAHATLLPSIPYRLSAADRDHVVEAVCAPAGRRGAVLDAIRIVGTRVVSVQVRCAPDGVAHGLPSFRRSFCENGTGRWTCNAAGRFVDYRRSSGVVTIRADDGVDVTHAIWVIDALDRLQTFFDAQNDQYLPLRRLLDGAVCEPEAQTGEVREMMCDVVVFRYRIEPASGQPVFVLLSAYEIFV